MLPLNTLLANLDPMERTLRLSSLRRRTWAPFVATVLSGTLVFGFLPSVLLGGLISAITHAVLRNRLARDLSQPASFTDLQAYR